MYLHGRNVNLSKRSNALRLPEMTKVTGAVQILIFFTVMAQSVFLPDADQAHDAHRVDAMN